MTPWRLTPLLLSVAAAQPEPTRGELVRQLTFPEANQGVDGDAEHYAVDNQTITKPDPR